MDKNARQFLNAVVDALEHFWLRTQAEEHLLDYYKVPHWEKLVDDWCELETSKSRAEKRFAAARGAIRLAQNDSEALEELVKLLGTKGKAN
jgi:hypothetical protein